MELARRIAVLPQSLELPAGFRVGELVAMGRLPHSRSLFGATREDAGQTEVTGDLNAQLRIVRQPPKDLKPNQAVQIEER